MIPVESVYEDRRKNRNNGHSVVIRSDQIELPAVPAEGKQEFDAASNVDEEEVQDEMHVHCEKQ